MKSLVLQYIFGLMLSIVFLTGCGGGGGSDTSSSNLQDNSAELTENTTNLKKTAYLFDSGVEGVKYYSNKGDFGFTGLNGEFEYTEGAEVNFVVGGVSSVTNVYTSGLPIGKITSIPSDSKVFIQDLVGVDRKNIDNEEVLRIARFLQALDDDLNPYNGIKISEDVYNDVAFITDYYNDNRISTTSWIEDKFNDTLRQLTLHDKVSSEATSYTTQLAKMHLHSSAVSSNIFSDTESKGNIDSKYYGEWYCLDNKLTYYIFSYTILEGFEAIDDDFIKFTDGGVTLGLMRASIANIKVTGKIDNNIPLIPTLSSVSRSLRDIADQGDIDVVLQHLFDKTITAKVKTDLNGIFQSKDLVSGSYSMSVDNGINNLNTIINVVNKENDIGSYMLTSNKEVSLKAELIFNDEILYADENEHNAIIRIHNIGAVVAKNISTDIVEKSKNIKSLSIPDSDLLDNITIEPNSYKDVPIKLYFSPIYSNEDDANITIRFKYDQIELSKDTLNFKLYKGYFNVSMETEHYLETMLDFANNAVIISPDIHQIVDVSYKTMNVPLTNSGSLLVANNAYNFDIKYSIGINVPTINTYHHDIEKNNHEPNNMTDQAYPLKINTRTDSILTGKDMDFFHIDTEENYLSSYLQSSTEHFSKRLGEVVETEPLKVQMLDGYDIDLNVSRGTIILNGVNTNLQGIKVKNNDIVSIYLKSSFSSYNQFVGSILSLGHIRKEYWYTSVSSSDQENFDIQEIDGGNPVTVVSNTITLNTIEKALISINKGSIILNGNDTNSTQIEARYGDQIAIKLTNVTQNDVVVLNIGGAEKRFEIFKSQLISFNGVEYKTIISSATNRVWLDRNLGAKRACISFDDQECYGDYYQWGRDADGHQVSKSPTTRNLQANLNTIGNSSFITNSSSPYDWSTADSDGVLRSANWSKTDGSSVCPIGFRVPTEDELSAERISNSNDAYTRLQLPSAGYRYADSLISKALSVDIWSSSPSGTETFLYEYSSSNAKWYKGSRADGLSVRCIRD